MEMTREQIIEAGYWEAKDRAFVGKNLFNDLDNLLAFEGLSLEVVWKELKRMRDEAEAAYRKVKEQHR